MPPGTIETGVVGMLEEFPLAGVFGAVVEGVGCSNAACPFTCTAVFMQLESHSIRVLLSNELAFQHWLRHLRRRRRGRRLQNLTSCRL